MRRRPASETTSYLFTQAIADLIEVFGLEEVLRAPLLNPGVIVGMVVQSEDRLDLLPVALLGRDAGTTLGLWVCDELVYDSQALGFRQWLGIEGLTGLSRGLRRSDAVDPVADSADVVLAGSERLWW